MNPNEKPSPYCDELTKTNVKKCKYYGEWLVDKDGIFWTSTVSDSMVALSY